jgi:hypothetical protein
VQDKFNKYTKQLVTKSVALTIVAEVIAPFPIALIQDRCPGALESRCISKAPYPLNPPGVPLYSKQITIITSSTALPL